MKQKKRKKLAFYKVVAKEIVAGTPFDISKNSQGWKKPQELVTLFMLRELSEADKYKIFPDMLKRVEGVFDTAIRYINENPDNLPEFSNIHVHKFRAEGKRNNECLSLKGNYRKAKERNTDRLIRRIEIVTGSAIKEIIKTQPERLGETRKRTMKLLPPPNSNLE